MMLFTKTNYERMKITVDKVISRYRMMEQFKPYLYQEMIDIETLEFAYSFTSAVKFLIAYEIIWDMDHDYVMKLHNGATAELMLEYIEELENNPMVLNERKMRIENEKEKEEKLTYLSNMINESISKSLGINPSDNKISINPNPEQGQPFMTFSTSTPTTTVVSRNVDSEGNGINIMEGAQTQEEIQKRAIKAASEALSKFTNMVCKTIANTEGLQGFSIVPEFNIGDSSIRLETNFNRGQDSDTESDTKYEPENECEPKPQLCVPVAEPVKKRRGRPPKNPDAVKKPPKPRASKKKAEAQV